MNKYVISVLVENQSGVLSKIASLFTRRGYNIESLSVGITNDSNISRMTISVFEDEEKIEQIRKQLSKLIPVIKVVELKSSKSIYRELALIKIRSKPENRGNLMDIANIFRGKIIDVSKESITIELTGDSEKIGGFIELTNQYGILEIVRTGLCGIQRGSSSLEELEN